MSDATATSAWAAVTASAIRRASAARAASSAASSSAASAASASSSPGEPVVDPFHHGGAGCAGWAGIGNHAGGGGAESGPLCGGSDDVDGPWSCGAAAAAAARSMAASTYWRCASGPPSPSGRRASELLSCEGCGGCGAAAWPVSICSSPKVPAFRSSRRADVGGVPTGIAPPGLIADTISASTSSPSWSRRSISALISASCSCASIDIDAGTPDGLYEL
eukprot:scaffold59914_cov49-Phaeocystis_antarctica.AAC.1